MSSTLEYDLKVYGSNDYMISDKSIYQMRDSIERGAIYASLPKPMPRIVEACDGDGYDVELNVWLHCKECGRSRLY